MLYGCATWSLRLREERRLNRSKVGINLNRVVSVDWFLVSCIVTGELVQIGQKKKRKGWHISQIFVLYGCGTWSLRLREERRLNRSKVGINLNRVVSVDWFLVSCIVTGELAQIGRKRRRWFFRRFSFCMGVELGRSQ